MPLDLCQLPIEFCLEALIRPRRLAWPHKDCHNSPKGSGALHPWLEPDRLLLLLFLLLLCLYLVLRGQAGLPGPLLGRCTVASLTDLLRDRFIVRAKLARTEAGQIGWFLEHVSDLRYSVARCFLCPESAPCRRIQPRQRISNQAGR